MLRLILAFSSRDSKRGEATQAATATGGVSAFMKVKVLSSYRRSIQLAHQFLFFIFYTFYRERLPLLHRHTARKREPYSTCHG
jgi:hypothetical protein